LYGKEVFLYFFFCAWDQFYYDANPDPDSWKKKESIWIRFQVINF